MGGLHFLEAKFFSHFLISGIYSFILEIWMLLSLFIINLNISLNFIQRKLDTLINYCPR